MTAGRFAWVAAALAAGISGGTAVAGEISLITTVDVQGKPLTNFDISYVDAAAGRYYLADRSNAGVDVIDTRTNRFIERIGGFVGWKGKSGASGPDGVVLAPDKQQLWVGDGDSTLKIIDLSVNPPKIVATVSTGGTARVDEMDYDPKDGVVLAANNADEPAFVTLISTGPDHRILAKVAFPEASDGIEQPAYVAETGLFYFSVPVLKQEKTHGAIGVFDPKSAKMVKMIPVDGCSPTGLSHGPGTKLVVGCAAGSADSGMPPATLIFDVASEKVVKKIAEVGAEDEVWYDAGTNRYYTASRGMPSGPVLGVIDAGSDTWVANVPTSKDAHSVAADARTHTVFVPLTPGPTCTTGCIGVFGSK